MSNQSIAGRLNPPKAVDIIKHLLRSVDFGVGYYVYNDRIVGGRSIKVLGWRKTHYEQTIQVLAKEGFFAKLIPLGYGDYRIHVMDKTS